jgi:two-component system, NtrC family, response regulator
MSDRGTCEISCNLWTGRIISLTQLFQGFIPLNRKANSYVNKQTSLLRQIENPALSPDQRAQLRCQLAKELEEAGNFEAARKAMGELWQRVGERPKVDDLNERTTAEVLLRAGALTAWIGSNNQIEEAQETAKNLIFESIRIFEVLHEKERVAEAYIDLAVCYWRAGAYDEARVTLREAQSLIADRGDELQMRAVLNSTIIEISAGHYNDALHILDSAASLFEASDNHALKGKFNMNLAIVLNNLSAGERREEYKDRALVEYAAASYHFEQARYTRFRAYTENNLGFLLFTLARFDDVHSHLDRARQLFASLKDPGCIAQVDETRARVFIAQQRYSEAERTVSASVRTLERGGQQSLLAEALTTHGTALARLSRYEESRFTLQRAIEVAHQAGALNIAGLAALTIVEELSKRLSLDEMLSVYSLADHLLNDTQHPQTLNRLRKAAGHVIAAGRAFDAKTGHAEPRAPDFVYKSEQIATLIGEAQRIAKTYKPVLITGEIGTGKGMLARLIHEWSGLTGKFVVVNCAALSETLIESQIFGHKRGVSTDAVGGEQGAVRRAAGGTLFLEEIEELSTSNQGKLLRLIDRDEFHSVGASAPERVSVRIIAATSSNLKEDVAQELFRKDLYYRLQAFELHIPPLRERTEDIPVLAEYLIEEAYERYGHRVTFTLEAIEAMRQLSLRGNALELRSLIERTVLTAPLGATIKQDAVETFVLLQTETGDLADVWEGCSLTEEVRRYEGNLIKMALDATHGHITHAARLLGTTHQGLAYILQGRQKGLLSARIPVRKRRRSIMGKRKGKQS